MNDILKYAIYYSIHNTVTGSYAAICINPNPVILSENYTVYEKIHFTDIRNTRWGWRPILSTKKERAFARFIETELAKRYFSVSNWRSIFLDDVFEISKLNPIEEVAYKLVIKDSLVTNLAKDTIGV